MMKSAKELATALNDQYGLCHIEAIEGSEGNAGSIQITENIFVNVYDGYVKVLRENYGMVIGHYEQPDDIPDLFTIIMEAVNDSDDEVTFMYMAAM